MERTKKKCRNRHNLYLVAETAFLSASNFDFFFFFFLLQLIFEPEMFKSPIGILGFLARKAVSRDQLPPKFAQTFFYMYLI